MSTTKIAYINRADSATLTADPVALSTAPVTFLQSDRRGYIFSATSSAAQQIKGQWGGTAYPISYVRLDRTNMVNGDTWRIQLYSDAAWTTQVYDSGTIAPFTTEFADWSFSFAEKWFTEVTGVKSFKITVTAATTLTAYRLFVGPSTTVTYDPNYGMTPSWVDNDENERTEGGSETTNQKSNWRKLVFDMSASTEADRAAWMEIGRRNGKRLQVVLSPFVGVGGTQERDHSIMGKFEESPSTRWSDVSLFDFSLVLNEG